MTFDSNFVVRKIFHKYSKHMQKKQQFKIHEDFDKSLLLKSQMIYLRE